VQQNHLLFWALTQETLDRLKTKGLIERIGADKGGYWNIKN
jgi:predicted HTH transcriptional regulator